MKVKIISGTDIENYVNCFIKDKTIIDIKYSEYPVITSYLAGTPSNIDIYRYAFIMYSED